MRRGAMHQNRGLALDRLDDLGMAIADGGHREAAIEVEIAPAIGILDMAAFGLFPDKGRILGEGAEPAAFEAPKPLDDVASPAHIAAHTRIRPFSAMTSPSISIRTSMIMPSRCTSLVTLPP